MTARTPEFDIYNSLLFDKNLIINGDMRIAQRGTSFTGLTSGGYKLDRFNMALNAGTISVSQDNDVPSSVNTKTSMKVDVTTPDGALDAGDYMGFIQPVEGYNFNAIAGKVFTLSFWAKSSLAGTYCVTFYNAAVDRCYIKEYTINQANTWELKEITVTHSLVGSWDFTTGIGLAVRFNLRAGSTFQGTAEDWSQNTKYVTSNQVDFAASANTFLVTNIKLEPGRVATPFVSRPYGQELALCQRYFYKWDLKNSQRIMTCTRSGNELMGTVPLPVPLRLEEITLGSSDYGTLGHYQLWGPTHTAEWDHGSIVSRSWSVKQYRMFQIYGIWYTWPNDVYTFRAVNDAAFFNFNAEL